MDFFNKVAETGHCPSNVVASIHIEMLREIRLGDKVHVETWCSRIGHKSMVVEQYIFANNICATQATVVLVGFDNKARASKALPEVWEPVGPKKLIRR